MMNLIGPSKLQHHVFYHLKISTYKKKVLQAIKIPFCMSLKIFYSRVAQ